MAHPLAEEMLSTIDSAIADVTRMEDEKARGSEALLRAPQRPAAASIVRPQRHHTIGVVDRIDDLDSHLFHRFGVLRDTT